MIYSGQQKVKKGHRDDELTLGSQSRQLNSLTHLDPDTSRGPNRRNSTVFSIHCVSDGSFLAFRQTLVTSLVSPVSIPSLVRHVPTRVLSSPRPFLSRYTRPPSPLHSGRTLLVTPNLYTFSLPSRKGPAQYHAPLYSSTLSPTTFDPCHSQSPVVPHPKPRTPPVPPRPPLDTRHGALEDYTPCVSG